MDGIFVCLHEFDMDRIFVCGVCVQKESTHTFINYIIHISINIYIYTQTRAFMFTFKKVCARERGGRERGGRVCVRGRKERSIQYHIIIHTIFINS